jgi:hypothetical protein
MVMIVLSSASQLQRDRAIRAAITPPPRLGGLPQDDRGLQVVHPIRFAGIDASSGDDVGVVLVMLVVWQLPRFPAELSLTRIQ